jgi:Ca-activated chloride channel family protein
MLIKNLLLLFVCVITLTSLSLKINGQQTPLFQSSTELVDLYVTVTDENGRLVPNLLREDFSILDNGQPQEIALFENSVRPITVIVMLDTSASTTNVMSRIMSGAEQFLIRMLPDDRGRVGAFNDKVEIKPEAFTGNRDDLIESLKLLDFGNRTRLYDAVEESLNALEGIDGRKVILLLTDGDDTDSNARGNDVLRRAIAEDVMIYSIGLEVEYFNGLQYINTRPGRNFRRLAEETGGGYFELRETDELGATFTRVAQELHSQYLLGFSPAKRDGVSHTLEIRVSGQRMNARARQSYIAPS